MATVESLSRLTAGAVNPAAATGRSSSKEQLSSAEIAGFLKGLTHEQMTFAQAKYCDDSESKINLLILTRKQAAEIANRGKWKTRPSQVDKLAELAVIEVMTKRLTGKVIAQAMGISEQAVNANWKDKFAQLLKSLYEYDAAVCRAVARNSCNH